MESSRVEFNRIRLKNARFTLLDSASRMKLEECIVPIRVLCVSTELDSVSAVAVWYWQKRFYVKKGVISSIAKTEIWHKEERRNILLNESRDSAVGTATDYGLDDRGVGVRVSVGSRNFSFPSNLLSSMDRGLFPGCKAAGGIKLTTLLQLVPRSRKCRSIHPLLHTPSRRSA
jgi:hypothetical protein